MINLKEYLLEGLFNDDPVRRHAVTTYNLDDRRSEPTYAVFAGSKLLTKGKTKQEAENMVNSKTLTGRFGKLTYKLMK
jgi:hypothetical protein